MTNKLPNLIMNFVIYKLTKKSLARMLSHCSNDPNISTPSFSSTTAALYPARHTTDPGSAETHRSHQHSHCNVEYSRSEISH